MKPITENIAEARAWFDGSERVALIEEEQATLQVRLPGEALAAEILLDCARLRLCWVVVYDGWHPAMASADSDWFWRAAQHVRQEWSRTGISCRFGVKRIPPPSAALAASYTLPPPGPAVVRMASSRAYVDDLARRWSSALPTTEISVLYVFPTLRDRLVHHVLSRPLILADEDDRALIRLLPEPELP